MRRANYVLSLLWCVSALVNSYTFIGFICVAVATYHAVKATKQEVTT